ncbi:hydrogenase maturation protease [Corallincola platygyrae]|uniref:Hydrogenase maturation protease n=1 Tax=Corallincola platygyrae TaxID=1193278 RepID=A0ABW4XI93_9GAMM
MNKSVPPNILILALGNREQGDDGFGPALYELMSQHPSLLAKVEQYASFVNAGLSLLAHSERIAQADWLIIVDAVNDPGNPGQIVLAELQQPFMQNHPCSFSTHQFQLLPLLQLLEPLGQCPTRITLLGASVVDTSLGSTLSPEVQALLPEAIDQLLQLLDSPTDNRGDRAILCMS